MISRWLSFTVILASLLAGSVQAQTTGGGYTPSAATSQGACGNSNPDGTAGDDPSAPDGDPVDTYTGNENRRLDDLALWGGVGQHRLTWTRWANSRATSGALLLGWGHNWRHGYQWDISDTTADTNGQARLVVIHPDGVLTTAS